MFALEITQMSHEKYVCVYSKHVQPHLQYHSEKATPADEMQPNLSGSVRADIVVKKKKNY